MIKHVIFDFADTLAELVPRREDIISDYIWKFSSVRVDANLIAKNCITLSNLMPYSSVEIVTEEQRMRFYQKYNRALFLNLGVLHLVDPTDLVNQFHKSIMHWEIKRGVLETICRLRDLGYKVSIISNFDKRLDGIINGYLAIGKFLDFIHISQIEQLEKPDTRFYDTFFTKNNVSIEESIYIGDSYSLDFLPAAEIGLRVFLLDERDIYVNVKNRIRDIREILGILERD